MINPTHFKDGHTPWNSGRRCERHTEEYHKHGNGNLHCPECCKERGRKSANKRHARLRNQALNAYGRQCACCGETEVKFLAIDHINGGGNKHRKEIAGATNRPSSGVLLRWLEKEGYPPGFQILCHNCNFAKHAYGVCPHQERG